MTPLTRLLCAIAGLFMLSCCFAVPPATNRLAPHSLDGEGILVSVPLPSSWRVEEGSKGLTWLVYKAASKDPTLFIRATPGDLEAAASSDGLFEKRNGAWYKVGRADVVKATAMSSKNWKGMYGIATCGISDEHGFHAAAGSCLQAIMSNGFCSVSIETDGMANTEWVLRSIVSNVQIQCPARARAESASEPGG